MFKMDYYYHFIIDVYETDINVLPQSSLQTACLQLPARGTESSFAV